MTQISQRKSLSESVNRLAGDWLAHIAAKAFSGAPDMIAPTTASSTYALRTLTEIASRLRASAPSAKTLPAASGAGLDPLRDAAANIARILLEAQSRTQASPVLVSDANYIERASGYTQLGASVLVDAGDGSGPKLKRLDFGASDAKKNVVLLRDANGTVSITTNGPSGSVTTQTGTLTGSGEDDFEAIAALNDKPTTIAVATDLDVDLFKGTAGSEFIAIATKGNVDRVSAGDGSDRVVIMGGLRTAAGSPKVDRIDGGNGDDDILIDASDVDRVTGGAGSDNIHIIGHGDSTVSRIDGGDDDDSIYVHNAGNASDISGGDGDDTIRVWAGTARNVAGGDGNDTIEITAATVQGVSGGRGDDTIRILNSSGSASTIDFNEGDGRDVIETNGPLELRRFNADGTQQDLSSATVAKNKDGTITISFADSTDSVTIRSWGGGAWAGFDLRTTESGGLVLAPRDPPKGPPSAMSAGKTTHYSFG